MLTPSEIVDIATVSQYLAVLDVAKGSLYGTKADPKLPLLIYQVRKAVQWAYAQSTSYTEIQKTANYLYFLCGKYALIAQVILDGSGGGSISTSPVGSSLKSIFPIKLTSADFESDGVSIHDSRLVGVNLAIFVNEIPTYLNATNGFAYTSSGITMRTGDGAAIPDFNANVNSYTLYIERLY